MLIGTILVLSGLSSDTVNGVIATGIIGAIASGILLYDSLVNVLSPHFSKRVFVEASTKSQVIQLFSLWLGAFVLALIGIWA
jgi:zinc transporter 1/2/3